MDEIDDPKLSLIDHLEELRKRIFVMLYQNLFLRGNRKKKDDLSMRFVRFGFRMVWFLSGCKAEIIGAENIPEDRAVLYIANHNSIFDIVLFVPTGYQVIENCLNDFFPVEHQIGEYLYDLKTPDFDALAPAKGRSWLENLWKRGK